MATTTSAVTTALSDLPATGTTPAAPSSTLGKDQFLLLLTTQLKYQDPLQPVDNQQMIAQLAQFSQLEQLQGLSGKIDSMVTSAAAGNQLATTQLVGKQATFVADRVGLVAGSPSSFDLTLADASGDTTAVLADSTGRVVRTLHLGALSAGSHAVSWDGLNDAGKGLASGEYILAVSGTRTDGTAVQATAQVKAVITGVAFEDGVAQVLVAGRSIPLSSVTEIDNPPAGS